MTTAVPELLREHVSGTQSSMAGEINEVLAKRRKSGGQTGAISRIVRRNKPRGRIGEISPCIITVRPDCGRGRWDHPGRTVVR